MDVSETGLLLPSVSFSLPTFDSPINVSSTLTSVEDCVDDMSSVVLSETMVLPEDSSELLDAVDDAENPSVVIVRSEVTSVVSGVLLTSELDDSDVDSDALVVPSTVDDDSEDASSELALETPTVLAPASVVLNSSSPDASSVMAVSDRLAVEEPSPETEENPSSEDTLLPGLGLVNSSSPEPVSRVPSVLRLMYDGLSLSMRSSSIKEVPEDCSVGSVIPDSVV